jgi:hypothetical protein
MATFPIVPGVVMTIDPVGSSSQFRGLNRESRDKSLTHSRKMLDDIMCVVNRHYFQLVGFAICAVVT